MYQYINIYLHHANFCPKIIFYLPHSHAVSHWEISSLAQEIRDKRI